MLKFKIKLSIFYLIFYFNWVYMAFINRQINKNWCTCSKQSIISSTFLSFGVSNIQEQARNAPFFKKIYSHCPLLSMHLFPVWTSTVLFSFLITYHGGEQHGLIFWTGNFIYGNVIFIYLLANLSLSLSSIQWFSWGARVWVFDPNHSVQDRVSVIQTYLPTVACCSA